MIASWGRELGSSFLSPSFVWLVSRLTFPHSCLSASRLGSCRLPTGSATPLAATRLGPLRGERSETRRGRRGKSGGRRRHQTRETTDDRGKGTYEWWILLWILWVSFHFIIKSIKSAIHPLSAGPSLTPFLTARASGEDGGEEERRKRQRSGMDVSNCGPAPSSFTRFPLLSGVSLTPLPSRRRPKRSGRTPKARSR